VPVSAQRGQTSSREIYNQVHHYHQQYSADTWRIIVQKPNFTVRKTQKFQDPLSKHVRKFIHELMSKAADTETNEPAIKAEMQTRWSNQQRYITIRLPATNKETSANCCHDIQQHTAVIQIWLFLPSKNASWQPCMGQLLVSDFWCVSCSDSCH